MKTSFFAIATLFLAANAPAATPLNTPQDICTDIATYNAETAVNCIKVIATGTFDAAATKVCAAIEPTSFTTAVACLTAVKEKTFQADAVEACAIVAPYNAATTVTCLQTIAGKKFENGTAGLCKQIMPTSFTQGTQCLADVGIVTTAPVCLSLKDVRDSINKALDAIFAGSPRTGVALLQGTVSSIDVCLGTLPAPTTPAPTPNNGNSIPQH